MTQRQSRTPDAAPLWSPVSTAAAARSPIVLPELLVFPSPPCPIRCRCSHERILLVHRVPCCRPARTRTDLSRACSSYARLRPPCPDADSRGSRSAPSSSSTPSPFSIVFTPTAAAAQRNGSLAQPRALPARRQPYTRVPCAVNECGNGAPARLSPACSTAS